MDDHEFIFYDDEKVKAWYCGMDVQKHKIAVAMYSPDIKDQNGIKTAIFSASADGLSQFWNFAKKYRPLGFVMEATGIYHHLPHKFLREKQREVEWDFQILVVNPADAARIP